MDKVFVVKFDWSTDDDENVNIFIYNSYDKAYAKFKDIIADEMNPELSWVGDIEFDNEGYPIDEEYYLFEFKDSSSGATEAHWYIAERDNYHQHSFIDLLIMEIM